MPTPTVADVVAEFPPLATYAATGPGSADITKRIGQALSYVSTCAFGEQYTRAVCLYAAHLVLLMNPGAAGAGVGSIQGPIQSVTGGGLSKTMAAPESEKLYVGPNSSTIPGAEYDRLVAAVVPSFTYV